MTKDQLETVVRIIASQAVDVCQAVEPDGTIQLLLVARSGDEVKIKAVGLSKDEAKNLLKQVFESN